MIELDGILDGCEETLAGLALWGEDAATRERAFQYLRNIVGQRRQAEIRSTVATIRALLR